MNKHANEAWKKEWKKKMASIIKKKTHDQDSN